MPEENHISLGPLSILTAYAIVTSLLYLFGYWSSFDINIFEYASFQDVLKLAIYPFSVAAFSVTVLFLLRTLTSVEKLKTGEVKNVFTPIPEKRAQIIVLISIVLMFVVYLFVKNDAWKWQLLGLLLVVVLVLSIDDVSFLIPYFPNAALRRLIFVVAVIFVSSAFGYGKSNAERILSGRDAKVISTRLFKAYESELFKAHDLLKDDDLLKYVGVAGDYFFFISMDNTKTFIVKYSDLHFIVFSKLPSLSK